MSLWQQKTEEIQKKIKDIFDNNLLRQGGFPLVIGDLVNKLTVQNLITSGGLQDTEQKKRTIEANNKIISDIEDNIITPLTQKLKDTTKTLDISAMLGKSGQLQQEIMNLETELKQAKEDADNQIARDSVLRSGETAVSKHQIFLLGRPIRQASIPYLWAIAALFFFLGLASIIMMAPMSTSGLGVGPTENASGIGSALGSAKNSLLSYFGQNSYGPSFGEQLTAIFGNYYILGLTIFSLTVVVIVLILKIMGKIK